MKTLLLALFFFLLGCGSDRSVESPVDKGLLPPGCAELVDGPPRGLSILHLSHPKARPQVEKTINLLAGLCIKRIALATLADPSFGLDITYLEGVVAKLSEHHELHLFFYLYNGSSQRRWENSAIQGLFTEIEPRSFRQRIQREESLKAQYRDMALSISDLTRNAQAMGAHVYWTFGLEDNLDAKSLKAMESILRPIMPHGVTLVRNPCPGCYPGNNVDYRGFIGEHHGDSLNFSSASMVVSNDGASDDLEKLAPVFERVKSYGGVFLYWNKAWQGLDGRGYIGANERNYVVPSLEEERRLKAFLEK
jgi:hypothetical protein